MGIIDITNLSWTLAGWRPFVWRVGKSVESGWGSKPDIGPFPAKVPGSVQQALLDAGVIADWNVGVNSRACEWVEHRHWDFTTEIPAGALPKGEPVVLDAQGLDYSGWILVDAKEVARFSGALTPCRVDLTGALGDGEKHQFSLVFEEPPREQGQFGYTSRSIFFKPRYNFSWDWCPRIVPIGPWDSLTLNTGAETAYDLAYLRSTLNEDNQTGRIEIAVAAGNGHGKSIEVRVLDSEQVIAATSCASKSGLNTLRLDAFPVEAWWPNGHGNQKLYTVEIVVGNGRGKPIWKCRGNAGFRRIEWQPCDGAPDGAEPWLCVVNGKPVFLQGANWVPPKAIYHDTTETDYVKLIDLYREMGATVFRVWGGGILEKEVFYDLCDRAGIFVWQEFPLSSSGVENAPPSAPEAIEELKRIASSYIRRRGHHASLLIWCGGNELTWEKDGQQVPVDYTHPCIAALREVVAKEDPGRRFIATSPTGPRFCATPEEFGQGIHHDIHGPWGLGGFKDIDAWREYWANDDALFRSEVGMPGAMNAEMIEKYRGKMKAFPPEGEYWLHTAAWWTLWDRFQHKTSTIDEYIKETQQLQAELYAVAAESCKRRFPKCGGFIIWMGHDCFPCPSNNSVIDFEGNPKPAYQSLKEVFIT